VIQETKAHQGQSLGTTLARLAAVLESDQFSTGERARLKRVSIDAPPSLSFYRFALTYLPEKWDASIEQERNWMTVVAGMAMMSPLIHDPNRRLGTVLAENRYSEARLERLLAAEGNILRFLVLRLTRFLAAKNTPVNWLDIATLLFMSQTEDQERVRKRIASDFYRIQQQNDTTTNDTK